MKCILGSFCNPSLVVKHAPVVGSGKARNFYRIFVFCTIDPGLPGEQVLRKILQYLMPGTREIQEKIVSKLFGFWIFIFVDCTRRLGLHYTPEQAAVFSSKLFLDHHAPKRTQSHKDPFQSVLSSLDVSDFCASFFS
jgi:hypothetical protein